MWVRTHTEMGNPKWFAQSCHLCHRGAFRPSVLLSVLGHEEMPFRKNYWPRKREPGCFTVRH